MKAVDQKNLPSDRLSTTDEKGKRVYVFPADVSGFWRNRRTIVQTFLIIFFLVAPWISLNGQQLILLDIEHRRFAIFGLTFWAHDIPIFFLVLLILTITLAFVTALWGRVWCGWACPQTVFIDGVFRRIERLVIGSHLAQIAMAKAPWTPAKVVRYSVKWLLFIAVGLVISHSFIAYFVGSSRIWSMISAPPSENWTAFVFMFVVTFLIVLDFGWFREQFCIIVCPYGKIQSLLMDQSSRTVVYDHNRGEPRGKRVAGSVGQGNCIDCYKCVSVCPTGIDIRRGVQLECIACTACIDACDDVMKKTSQPVGLIRYDSHDSLAGKKSSKFSGRSFVYLAMMFFAVLGLAWSVGARKLLDVTVVRGHDSPYELVSTGELAGKVLNHFKLNIKNQKFEDLKVQLQLENQDGVSRDGDVRMILPFKTLSLKSGELQRHPLFIYFPQDKVRGTGVGKVLVRIEIEDHPQDTIHVEVPLVGPF